MNSAAVRPADETRNDEQAAASPLQRAKNQMPGDPIDHEAAALNTTASTASGRRIRGKRDEVELPTGWWYRLGVWLERKVSKLSVRNNFWHRLTSWIWMPLAYRSGIHVHKGSVGTFSALLPFRRFNRNWYKAMAGGALLANCQMSSIEALPIRREAAMSPLPSPSTSVSVSLMKSLEKSGKPSR